VIEGLTVMPAALVTVPTPLSIDKLVAPVADQLNLELWPAPITEGVAVKLLMITLGTTITDTVAVTLPAVLVAVRV